MRLSLWNEDPRVVNAQADLDRARRAEADALDALDRATSERDGTKKDLDTVIDETAAEQVEALLVRARADVEARQQDLEAAQRAVRRAQARYAPLRAAARRDAAEAARAELDARLDAIVAVAEELRARAEAVRECNEFIAAQFETDSSVLNGTPTGMVAADVREFFNVPHPLLGLYPRLMKTVCGHGYRSLDAWIALAREWRR